MNFIDDQYQKARGGYSFLLKIHCERCDHLLALYQKDGNGPLRRMYIDRILEPKIPYREGDFICPSCGKIIGTFYLYEKENDRPAIRLYQDSVTIVKRKRFLFW